MHGQEDLPVCIVLHGGPAAEGSARGLALGLSDTFRVYEPHQRGSGSEPLSVARHIADIHGLIKSEGLKGYRKPTLVGHSWGAMLALAYSSAHPKSVRALALVGCGTFDLESRARLNEILEERNTEELRIQLDQLNTDYPDPRELIPRKQQLSRLIYSYDPIESPAHVSFDLRAHIETWEDMMRLQNEGIYPAAFKSITAPAIILHGSFDPHPGQMIYANLKRHISQLEYKEWQNCGHEPWIERQVKDDFFAFLKQWLLNQVDS